MPPDLTGMGTPVSTAEAIWAPLATTDTTGRETNVRFIEEETAFLPATREVSGIPVLLAV